jgi:hypothetical protein
LVCSLEKPNSSTPRNFSCPARGLGIHARPRLLHLSIGLHCLHLSVHPSALAASHRSVCCCQLVRCALIDSSRECGGTRRISACGRPIADRKAVDWRRLYRDSGKCQ